MKQARIDITNSETVKEQLFTKICTFNTTMYRYHIHPIKFVKDWREIFKHIVEGQVEFELKKYTK
jgi:hypothetical protein